MQRPRPTPTALSADRISRHERRGEWPHPDLTTALERRTRETADRVLYVAGSERLGARELARRVSRLARGLRGLGVGAGDVVSWQLPNWLEGVVLTFALDRLGAISNPVLPIYREREVGFIARQAKSRVLVVPGELRGCDHRALARAVAAEAPDLEHVLVARAEPAAGQRSFEALSEEGEDRDGATPPGPHDVSALFYTSGTTSDPKGVMHTPSTLGAFQHVQFANAGHDRDAVGIVWFPLTHIGGICAFGSSPVLHGTRAVFLEQFDPDTALELIEREGVTSAGGPTPILQALLATPGFSRERVRSVRIAGLGATDVPPELMRELGERLGAFVFRSYGMTECPMATAGRRGDPDDALVGTDGRPSSGVTVRVVDDAGRELPAGSEGEVELFGPQLCVGYLDPALSREAFTADGFLRSGDLAVVDERGFVRITGRKKDVIIRKGENLSAKAIEDELHEHPSIADAAVIGVPDRASGERVCACVVVRPDGAAPTLDELRAFMRERGVMAQKIPEQLEVVGELPRTATGKVKKHELRARFAPAPAGRVS
ncbi:MAG: AMP-binding protein [Thermodesulfobacteriota bacterium]